MKKIATIVVAAGLVLSGCAGKTPDEQFIADFRENMVVNESVTDNNIVAAGKALCRHSELAGAQETIDFMVMDLGAKSEDAAIEILSSAERHIC